MSQPVVGGKVPVIGEESSGNEYTSGGGLGLGSQKRKKKVKTNKTFAEPPPMGGRPPRDRTPNPHQAQNSGRGAQGNLMKNNFV